MKAISKLVGAAMLIVLGTAFQAQALVITPATVPQFSGNETSQDDIDDVLEFLGIPTDILYKQDVGGAETGPFAGSYETEFFNEPDDPEDADIEYVGGPVIDTSSPTYLLVKDGNQEPAWYLFNLTALGWDGEETIELRGFWPDQGAISHVQINGGGESVPDGGITISLLGSALVGLGLLRRKLSV